MRRKGQKNYGSLASPLPLTEDKRQERALTFPGMASWGGSGPKGKTCRECEHWLHKGGYYATGVIFPAVCRKAKALMVKATSVPDFASACKFFLENPNPPERFRSDKDRK